MVGNKNRSPSQPHPKWICSSSVQHHIWCFTIHETQIYGESAILIGASQTHIMRFGVGNAVPTGVGLIGKCTSIKRIDCLQKNKRKKKSKGISYSSTTSHLKAKPLQMRCNFLFYFLWEKRCNWYTYFVLCWGFMRSQFMKLIFFVLWQHDSTILLRYSWHLIVTPLDV